MSVNSYLMNLSGDLVLSAQEKASINKSIETLSARLDWHFKGGDLHKHFQFGSSTRNTILPRSKDSSSDIDYMVVFKNPYGYKPDTLLNYLKQFIYKYYSRSEVYRDSPTMVLELNHIKFEIVPAIQDGWGNLSIPSKKNLLSDWMPTNPIEFNQKLTTANVNNNNRIKPVVRLMKYWNTYSLEHYYSSFLLEEWLVNRYTYRPENTVRDYIYDSIRDLSLIKQGSQSFNNKLTRSKEIVRKCEAFEARGDINLAVSEIKKIFPVF